MAEINSLPCQALPWERPQQVDLTNTAPPPTLPSRKKLPRSASGWEILVALRLKGKRPVAFGSLLWGRFNHAGKLINSQRSLCPRGSGKTRRGGPAEDNGPVPMRSMVRDGRFIHLHSGALMGRALFRGRLHNEAVIATAQHVAATMPRSFSRCMLLNGSRSSVIVRGARPTGLTTGRS
jgi:hypothetical protein